MISGIKLLPRNLLSNAMGVIVGVLASMLTLPFLVKCLGEQAYGVYTVAMSITGILGSIQLGLTSAATKYIAEVEVRKDIKMLEQVISTNLSLYVGLGTGVVVLFVFVAPHIVPLVFHAMGMDQLSLTLVIRLVGALVGLNLVRNALSSVLRGFQRYDIYNAIQVSYAVGLALIQLLIVASGGRVATLMLGSIVVTMMSVVGLRLVVRRMVPRIRLIRFPDHATFRILFTFGMYMMLSNAAGMFLINVDKIIVGRALGATAVTYYSVPAHLALRIHGINAPIISVLLPLASEIQSTGDIARLRGLYIRGMRSVTLIAGLIGVFLAAFAREILAIWISSDFAAMSAPILVLLSMGYLFFSLNIVPYYILIGTGRPKELAVLHIVVSLFGILCISIGAYRLGLIGAATGMTVGMGAMVVFPGFVQRLLAISWKEAFVESYGWTLLYSVMGIAVGVLLSNYLAARLLFYPFFAIALVAWGNVKQEDWEIVRSMWKRVLAYLPVLT